jgi:ribosome-binding factor A
MPTESRARRVADRIFRELAVILQREVSDPRLSTINVTDVEVDRELAFATIYISTLNTGDQDHADDVLNALAGASGFLRSQLAGRIQLRVFPKLRFRWDPSPDRGARVDELLDELRREEQEAEE